MSRVLNLMRRVAGAACAVAAGLLLALLLSLLPAAPAAAQTAGADLTVSNVSVGAVVANANGSFTIPVTYTVTNVGSAATAGSWYDMGYLSADGVLDNADQSQGYLNNQTVMLAPGASYTLTKSFTTTTATTPGTYTFIVKADGHSPAYTGGSNTDGGGLVEANEANNTASATVTLNRPDLTVGALTIGAIVANANGSFTIPVTYTVTNVGAAATAASWYDLGYLSTDGLLDNADQSQGYLNNPTAMLAPGASYTVTKSFTTTTTTTPGTYTFIVKADGHSPAYTGGSNTDGGGLVEANEANNTASATVTLNRPDLTVGPLTIGAIVANANGSFTIPATYTVTNIGAAATAASWYDLGYLSTDGVLDNADQSQGYLNNPTAMLAPGASYTVTKSFTTTTATAPGTYTFIVKADGHSPGYTGGSNTDGGGLVEANEANNTASAAVTLNRPDLTVSPLTIGTIVANANGSFTIPVTYTVTNTGAAVTASSWYDLGYLSADGVLDNTDQSQGYLNNPTVMLTPGASYTVTKSFTTTTTTTPGTYSFIVKADGHNPAFTGGSNTDTGNLVEASDANNTAAVTVTLSRPDLTVGPITLGTPTQNTAGSFSIPVTYTVTNVGAAATGGSWYDIGYLSADGVLDDADQSQGYLNNPTVMLTPGASYTVSKTFTTSTTTGGGNYTFFVKVDGHNATFTGGSNTDGGNLVETNEANNTASAPLTLIVKVATTTTLSSSLNPLQAGQSSTLNATVSPPEATGTVVFKDNGNVLASVPVSGGRATTVALFSSAGSHSLTAEYGGDTYRLASASAALVQTVNTFNSSLTLSATPQPAFTNRAVKLTAAVASAQGGGTVTFRDGANTLATLLLKGSTVTYYPTISAAGAHSLSATYSGDANNTVATSNTVALTVNATAMPTGALVRQFGYDSNGNRKWDTDANGNRTDHAFDGLNRPQSDTGPAPAAGSARPVVSYGRNAADTLTSVTDPRNLATAYTVDGLGNRKATNSPDAGQGSATYDAAGRVATRTDARGKLTRYTYDAIDRLTRIDYVSGTPTVFEYDGGASPTPTSVGKLTKITDESGGTSYTHDGFGHVLTKTQVTGSGSTAKTFNVSYAWGASGAATGKPVSITYPSGSRVNYAYAATGRLSAITLNPVNANGVGTNTATTVPVLNTIAYSGANDVLSWTWGNGATYRRTIDTFGRLTSLPLGNPSGTGTAAGLLRTLQYDNGRNILAFRHTQAGVAQPLLDQSFLYDALDHLTDATVAGTHYGYAYDLNGNRTTRVIGSTSYASTVAATSNRLLQVQSPGTNGSTQTGTWVHDAAGNLTSDGSITFAYSDRGRMKSATVSGGTVSYLYNGLEQRVSKTAAKTLVPTGGAFYVYDEQGRLLGEYDADGVPIHETVWLGDLPVAVLKQTGTAKQGSLQVQVYDVYADHLATPRVITRATDQAVVWRWDGAEPFGASGPDENPKGVGVFRFDQRFPGQVFDAETGLMQNVNREYDARAGRYRQSDPVGLSGGVDTYGYVRGNPLSFADPNGLLAQVAGCVLGLPFGGPLGCAAGGVITTVATGITLTVLMSIPGDTPKADDCPPNRPCRPCMTVSGRVVPTGTVAYRPMDTPPAGKTEHGINGPHFNIYKANQNPNNCQCFWQPLGAVAPTNLPPGSIPIEPFAN